MSITLLTHGDKVQFNDPHGFLQVGIYRNPNDNIEQDYIQYLTIKDTTISVKFVTDIQIVGKASDNARVIPVSTFAPIIDNMLLLGQSHDDIREWMNDMPGIAFVELIDETDWYLYPIEQPQAFYETIAVLRINNTGDEYEIQQHTEVGTLWFETPTKTRYPLAKLADFLSTQPRK